VVSTSPSPVVSFSYKNIQKITNAGYIGIIVGASVGLSIILLIVVICVSRKYTRDRLRELQKPNIVYFLKKKVLSYLKGEKDEVDRLKPPPRESPYDYGHPPPPPPPKRVEESRYAPIPEKKENYDHLIIPPPLPVEDFDINADRIPTSSEIRPSPGIPDF